MKNQNSRGAYSKDRMPTISRKVAIFGALALLAISGIPSSAVLAQATGTDSSSGTGTSEDSRPNNSGRRSLFQQILDAAARRSEEGNGRNNRDSDRDVPGTSTNSTSTVRATSTVSTSSSATTSRNGRSTSTPATSTRATSSPATTTAAATSTRGTSTATTSTSTRPVAGTADSARPGGTAGGTFTPIIDLRSPGTFTGTLQGLLNPAYADQRKLDPETTSSLLTLSVFLLLSGLGLATGAFEKAFRRITGTALTPNRAMSPEMETRVNVNPYPES